MMPLCPCQPFPQHSTISQPNSIIFTCFCSVLTIHLDLDQIFPAIFWGLIPPYLFPSALLFLQMPRVCLRPFPVLFKNLFLFPQRYIVPLSFLFSCTDLLPPLLSPTTSNTRCPGTWTIFFPLCKEPRMSFLSPDPGHLKSHNHWKKFFQHKSNLSANMFLQIKVGVGGTHLIEEIIFQKIMISLGLGHFSFSTKLYLLYTHLSFIFTFQSLLKSVGTSELPSESLIF